MKWWTPEENQQRAISHIEDRLKQLHNRYNSAGAGEHYKREVYKSRLNTLEELLTNYKQDENTLINPRDVIDRFALNPFKTYLDPFKGDLRVNTKEVDHTKPNVLNRGVFNRNMPDFKVLDKGAVLMPGEKPRLAGAYASTYAAGPYGTRIMLHKPGSIDDTGDIHLANAFDHNEFLDLFEAEGLGEYTDDGFVMYPHAVKALMPAYRELIAMAPEVKGKGEQSNTFNNHWPKMITAAGIKNFLKSPSTNDAFEKLGRMYLDYREEYNDGFWGPVSSINEMEAMPARVNAAVEQQSLYDEALEILEDFNRKEEDHGYDPMMLAKLLDLNRTDDPSYDAKFDEFMNVIKARKAEEAAVPYGIAEEVQKALPEGWRVLNSKQELLDSGVNLRLCYGDLKTYGDEHHKKYHNSCRDKNTLLVTDGSKTFEAIPEFDENGKVTNVKIGQVMAYDNEVIHPSQVLNATNSLTTSLLGRKRGDISDRLLKAVNRRFL